MVKLKFWLDAFIWGCMPQILAFSFSLVTLKAYGIPDRLQRRKISLHGFRRHLEWGTVAATFNFHPLYLKDRGIGEPERPGGTCPPPQILELWRVNKKRCLVPPPPPISSHYRYPSPPTSKLFRSPCISATLHQILTKNVFKKLSIWKIYFQTKNDSLRLKPL